MVKIQLELTEKEDFIVSIYKIENKQPTKQEAIKKIITEYKKLKELNKI